MVKRPQQFDVAVARGHPGNPLDRNDMHQKFLGLLPPSTNGQALFERLRNFGDMQAHNEPLLVQARSMLATPSNH